jgi:Ca2+-binding EF-hand superfamily protein
MKAANHKIVRHSIFLGGVLSLVLIPAFAGDQPFPEHSSSTQTMEKEGMHGKWFQKLDKNGDGKISKEEFQLGADNKFERIDSNKDGYVTKEELQAAAKQWKGKHKKGHHMEGM